jgi:hypothetical protein
MTDDNLDDLDLHAWQAPPPPNGLAESVIARATATDEAISVAMRHQRRRYAIIGAACAGSIAAGLALWLGLQPSRAVADNVIIADKSQHVALGASAVDLDPGSALRWHRTGDELHVVQSGTATWRVASNERLVIDAGSSASIEATGASLRVEAKMNPSYVRVMSGVALTAAAVALVSATVYEGHVKATTGDGTVVVLPQNRATIADNGSRLEIAGLDQLARDQARLVDLVAAERGFPLKAKRGDLAIVPGQSAVIRVTAGVLGLDTSGVDVEFQAPCELRVDMHGDPKSGPSEQIASASNGILMMPLQHGKHEYTASCTGGPPMTGTLEVVTDDCRHQYCTDEHERLLKLDAPDLGTPFAAPTVHVAGTVVDGATLSIGGDVIAIDNDHAFAIDLSYAANQTVVLRVDHPTRGTEFYVQHSAPAGAATVAKPPAPAVIDIHPDPKHVGNKAGARQIGPHEIEVTIPDVHRSPLPSPDQCDAAKLVADGAESSSEGNNTSALKKFEAAYECKADTHTLSLAFMASCNAENVRRARFWWRKMSTMEQDHLVVMCMRARITREMLDAQ